VRFDVSDSTSAESVRRKIRDPVLAPLFDVLAEHRAAPKCQCFCGVCRRGRRTRRRELFALRVDEGDDHGSSEERKLFEILYALRERTPNCRHAGGTLATA